MTTTSVMRSSIRVENPPTWQHFGVSYGCSCAALEFEILHQIVMVAHQEGRPTLDPVVAAALKWLKIISYVVMVDPHTW
jgi:hypothetical protein